jgi:cation:H+ antiporter
LELVVRNGEQLAVVTSLPNMSTALRLVRQGRGDATVSETLNSNSINLVGGVIIPAAILGLGHIAADAEGDLLWLTVLTGRSLVALAHPRGMGRLAGLALVGGFVAFVVSHVV